MLLVITMLTNIPLTAFATEPNLENIVKMQIKQIKSLSNRLTVIEQQNKQLKTELDDIKQLLSRGSTLNNTTAAEQSIIKQDDNQEPIIEGEKAEYDAALAALKRNQYIQAETAFAEFIKNHPESKLQSNANFWYAESFFRRKIYNKAAVNFLRTYQQYPKGSKAPDSLLKLAISLSHLQKKQEACSMLDKLEAEFPNRPAESLRRAKEVRTNYCQ